MKLFRKLAVVQDAGPVGVLSLTVVVWLVPAGEIGAGAETDQSSRAEDTPFPHARPPVVPRKPPARALTPSLFLPLRRCSRWGPIAVVTTTILLTLSFLLQFLANKCQLQSMRSPKEPILAAASPAAAMVRFLVPRFWLFGDLSSF